MKLLELYERVGYKKLMFIPIIFMFLCIFYLLFYYQSTGEFLSKGVDLKGGSQLTVDTAGRVDAADLEAYLGGTFGDVQVRTTSGLGVNSVIIRTGSGVDKDLLLEKVREYGIDVESNSFEEIGTALGESFFVQSRTAIIVAFVFMGFVVFIIFKNIVPSLAVIWCAFSDIICTIAVVQFLGMSFSLASFAALLLVLGYSIDTDILLTTRVLKRREGSFKERIAGAVKTGLTMSATTLVALFALLIVSGATAIQDIATILIVALMLDVPNTWLTNLGVLRLWMERKGIV